MNPYNLEKPSDIAKFAKDMNSAEHADIFEVSFKDLPLISREGLMSVSDNASEVELREDDDPYILFTGYRNLYPDQPIVYESITNPREDVVRLTEKRFRAALGKIVSYTSYMPAGPENIRDNLDLIASPVGERVARVSANISNAEICQFFKSVCTIRDFEPNVLEITYSQCIICNLRVGEINSGKSFASTSTAGLYWLPTEIMKLALSDKIERIVIRAEIDTCLELLIAYFDLRSASSGLTTFPTFAISFDMTRLMTPVDLIETIDKPEFTRHFVTCKRGTPSMIGFA
jgi:hypothetical protein